MTRNRREVLRALGLVTIGSIAGCSESESSSDATPTGTDERTPTATLTPSPAQTSTDAPASTSADTATTTPTDTPASTPTDTSTSVPTDTAAPTDTATSSPENTSTSTPTDSPTSTPTDSPTATPTDSPTPVRQATKLAAADGDPEDEFGYTVAVSSDGTTAIVGAYDDEDPNGPDAGSAYVFVRSGGAWSQQTKLAPDDGGSNDHFGSSVAVSSDGTIALVGADATNTRPGENAGSAYVFSRTGGAWSQQAELTHEDSEGVDLFGGSVALSGDGTTAVIGAPLDEEPNGKHAGSAYVFSRTDGPWSRQAKLAPDDGDPGVRFGSSVAVSDDGTTALVGAENDEDPNGADAGSAYAFSRSGETWSQQAKLAPDDGDRGDAFGFSVAISSDGTTALIGANYDEDPNGDSAGSAYVFSRTDGPWSRRAKLAPDDGDSLDNFGWSVALSGDGSTAVVGARLDEDPNGSKAGSAYAFSQSGGKWSQQAKLVPDDGNSNDRFGYSAAVSGDGTIALIGASLDEHPHGNSNADGGGSAYVFDV